MGSLLYWYDVINSVMIDQIVDNLINLNSSESFLLNALIR